MSKFSFDDALIDVADIWNFEQTRYGGSEPSFLQELRHSLIPFYILKKHEPFVSNAAVYSNPSLKSYYDSYENRLTLESEWNLDFFKYREAFYDMNVSCVINKEDVIPELYEWLLMMKLRQLEGDVEQLNWFLGFHYHETFKSDEKQYRDFLSSLLLYSDLLKPTTISSIEAAVSKLEILPPKDVYKVEDFERPSWEEFHAMADNDVDSKEDLTDSLQENEVENNAVIILEGEAGKKLMEKPAAPISILNIGKWTKEEIDHYFSFLYKVRGEGEGSYLTEEQVKTIFQNGIEVPAKPLDSKFQLNVTKRYPKTIVHYAIYQFIQVYNKSKKKMCLQFFGSYIMDYENALNERAYSGLSSNITGEKPGNRFFRLKDYVPKRFHSNILD